MKPQKTVRFNEEMFKENQTISRQNEPAKWVAGLLAYGMDCMWKWAGARDGLQNLREYGDGFEGWYWRSSVVSCSPTFVGSRG